MINEIINQFTKHQQVLKVFLIKQFIRFTYKINNVKNTKSINQKESVLAAQNHKSEVCTVVDLPMKKQSKIDEENILLSISNAPIEIILYASICIPVVDWGIKTIRA